MVPEGCVRTCQMRIRTRHRGPASCPCARPGAVNCACPNTSSPTPSAQGPGEPATAMMRRTASTERMFPRAPSACPVNSPASTDVWVTVRCPWLKGVQSAITSARLTAGQPSIPVSARRWRSAQVDRKSAASASVWSEECDCFADLYVARESPCGIGEGRLPGPAIRDTAALNDAAHTAHTMLRRLLGRRVHQRGEVLLLAGGAADEYSLGSRGDGRSLMPDHLWPHVAAWSSIAPSIHMCGLQVGDVAASVDTDSPRPGTTNTLIPLRGDRG